MKRFFRRNGLSLWLAGLFLLFWSAQAFSGWHLYNQEAAAAASPPLTFPAYLGSGHFWQATGENWESEFLQMGAYVLLTCFLYQKGSAESNDPDAPGDPQAAENKKRFGWLYRNSLSLAFLALFLLSFWLHAAGGLREWNEGNARRGEPEKSMSEFLRSAEFRFQSFQNWQSEFLAVLAIVVLSIFLRQNASPESKPMGAANGDTGA